MKREIKIDLSYTRIVVAVLALGILAKFSSPKPPHAAITDNTSALIAALVMGRANLDVYRAEHAGLLPPTDYGEGFVMALTGNCDCCGPYIDSIPANPFNRLDTVRFDGAPAGVGLAGWRLDTGTGRFQADNDTTYAQF